MNDSLCHIDGFDALLKEDERLVWRFDQGKYGLSTVLKIVVFPAAGISFAILTAYWAFRNTWPDDFVFAAPLIVLAFMSSAYLLWCAWRMLGLDGKLVFVLTDRRVVTFDPVWPSHSVSARLEDIASISIKTGERGEALEFVEAPRLISMNWFFRHRNAIWSGLDDAASIKALIENTKRHSQQDQIQ